MASPPPPTVPVPPASAGPAGLPAPAAIPVAMPAILPLPVFDLHPADSVLDILDMSIKANQKLYHTATVSLLTETDNYLDCEAIQQNSRLNELQDCITKFQWIDTI